jgi:hypothetical protein
MMPRSPGSLPLDTDAQGAVASSSSLFTLAVIAEASDIARGKSRSVVTGKDVLDAAEKVSGRYRSMRRDGALLVSGAFVGTGLQGLIQELTKDPSALNTGALWLYIGALIAGLVLLLLIFALSR